MMTLQHGGLVRRYRLGLVPPDWKEHAPLPVVVVLHDERGSCDQESNVLSLPPRAGISLFTLLYPNFLASLPADGPPFWTPPPGRPTPAPTFLLVIPEGVSLGRKEGDSLTALPVSGNAPGMNHCGWNSGHRGFDGRMLRADDVGFIEALLTELQDVFTGDLQRWNPRPTGATEGLDLSRLYVVGCGNGGEMAYKLTCELPTRPKGYAVRSVAVVGGSVGGWWNSTEPLTELVNSPFDTGPPPPDVLLVHGLLDNDYVPFQKTQPQVSEAEQDRMAVEVDPSFVLAATPATYGLDFSRDMWVTWMRNQIPLTNPLPPEVEILVPTGVIGGLPGLPRTLRVQQYVFSDPVPGPILSARVRYLTTVLDERLHHDPPTWDLGRMLWDAFTQPASLVP